ncbi:aminotransferase class III-fold pyridoxal phosphate-dependent enzyme [Nocardioides sp. TF02-7]|uniref:aminotransferase class III-fold pyridoxal phosphate-dependent enzyme n=1 Tax=Nocardioides sp. TF02-7 TaxID=2917724 RepID=UPI001F06630B|nr:aminotransferase class III-fold pyridoxal phosphate-dependent enzyme [Nocardioides sp. TF02-7]UMG92772.1 aminotransferase class III-fold pyridoxal phosphate-dependent enzyme [Nocardioides sp. TF02-7]
MTRWPGAFPVTFATAQGARFTDVDGIEYVDLCLGDSGAMTGHALPQVAEAVERQARAGITTMLPSEDAVWVAEELARRFGLPSWQLAMSATDANRFVLRFARALTGRPRVAVIDWCYHGTVDETFAVLGTDGSVVARPGSMGPQVDVALTTAVVPCNDLDALDRRLGEGDVACLLMEPALTNIGIVLPEVGYLAGIREVTRKHGVLLVIDETHTLCAGPGGATAAWGLEPDLLVVGKAIGGGVPVAAYGMTGEVADRLTGPMLGHDIDVAGVGGTPDRQRARARGDPSDAVDLPAGGGLRGRGPPRRTVHRRRRRRDRLPPPPLDGAAPRVPRGVLVLPSAAHRRRGRRRRRPRSRGVLPPVGAQPRDPADAVPQHGAVQPVPHAGRRRPPHRGVRVGGRGARALKRPFSCPGRVFLVTLPQFAILRSQ